jgi:hypothetical protein
MDHKTGMRNIFFIFFIALLAGIASWVWSWQMIAVMPFLVVVNFNLKKGFLFGFISIILLWLVLILFADIRNEHILSMKMTKLFGLPHYSLLILINMLLGGLIGGLGGWSGAVMNKAFRKNK